MSHECKYEKVIDMIDKRTERIESKVDSLIETRAENKGRWMVIAILATAFLSIASIVSNLFAK